MASPTRFALVLLLLVAPVLAGDEAPADERLDRAKVEIRDHEYRAAERIFREILREDPTNRRAHLGLARCLRGVGEHPAAAAIYDALIELDPTDPRPHVALGLLAIYIDRKAEARRHCETALRHDPEHAPALAAMARVEIEQKKYSAAHRLLVKAEKIEPDRESVLSARSEYRFRTKDMGAAVRLIRRILELNPRAIEAHIRLARGFIEPGRPYWKPPEVPLAYATAVYSAVRKYRALDLDGAEAAFRTLDGPESPDARPAFHLGLIALRRGKVRIAIAHLWRALDREPENFLVRNALGVAYRNRIRAQRAEHGGGPGGVDRLRPLIASLPAPAVKDIDRFVRGYRRLLPEERRVVLRAVAPLASFLPVLIRTGIRHDVLGFEEGMCDAKERQWIRDRRTLDGRWYGALRGVGGRHAATGIEAIREAGAFDYDTFAHEFAHQVHRFALSAEQKRVIEHLYSLAKKDDLCLDYYAASNHMEYFAQGYEAFVSVVKSPFHHSLRRHTRAELADRDPGLYEFIRKLTGTPDPDPALVAVAPGVLRFYEWAGDGIELSRAKELFGPLTPAAAEPK
ncbi:MAG: tetratricopeptide repeat protein [Planctomycetota bacterium]